VDAEQAICRTTVRVPAGEMAAETGDWIVTVAPGRRCVVRADRFAEMYEPVRAEARDAAGS